MEYINVTIIDDVEGLIQAYVAQLDQKEVFVEDKNNPGKKKEIKLKVRGISDYYEYRNFLKGLEAGIKEFPDVCLIDINFKEWFDPIEGKFFGYKIAKKLKEIEKNSSKLKIIFYTSFQGDYSFLKFLELLDSGIAHNYFIKGEIRGHDIERLSNVITKAFFNTNLPLTVDLDRKTIDTFRQVLEKRASNMSIESFFIERNRPAYEQYNTLINTAMGITNDGQEANRNLVIKKLRELDDSLNVNFGAYKPWENKYSWLPILILSQDRNVINMFAEMGVNITYSKPKFPEKLSPFDIKNNLP